MERDREGETERERIEVGQESGENVPIFETRRDSD